MTDGLIPITDEQAKLGTKALEVLHGAGGFIREALGTVPQDLVGLCGGDWLMVRRAENVVKLIAKAEEKLRERGVEHPQQASLTVVLPLFQAAANESREELQDIWARLLAAAVDPSRSRLVRQSFVVAVKQMDPLDAQVLMHVRDSNQPAVSQGLRDELCSALKASIDEVCVSIESLRDLKLLNSATDASLTPLGREFLRACFD